MRSAAFFLFILISAAFANAQTPATAAAPAPPDPIKPLVDRLDLERYKATIQGLTKFGDRRQGTERNRAANDWIEAQLNSYGCTNAGRLTYDYQVPVPATGGAGRGGGGRGPGRGGVRTKGQRGPTGVNNDPLKQPDEKLRELNTPPSVSGERQEVYCTKIGTKHP